MENIVVYSFIAEILTIILSFVIFYKLYFSLDFSYEEWKIHYRVNTEIMRRFFFVFCKLVIFNYIPFY